MGIENETALTQRQEAGVAAYQPTINLPVLACPEEALAVIAENMEGMSNFKFVKVNMPSGGGIAFTVIDDNGEEQPIKEIIGVLMDKWGIKVWYEKSFEEKGANDIGIPDCFSADGVTGSGCPRAGIQVGQLCATCPKNQWGSDRRGGKGKDCADKIRIHLLQEGEMFPIYIDAPPTSLGNFEDYIQRLSNKVKPYYGVTTKVKLEQAVNAGGIKYSKLAFAKVADLTKEERQAMKQYMQTLMPSMRRITKESFAEVAADAGGQGAAGQGHQGAIIEAAAGAEVGSDDQPY